MDDRLRRVRFSRPTLYGYAFIVRSAAAAEIEETNEREHGPTGAISRFR
jgi:hypothetical protein